MRKQYNFWPWPVDGGTDAWDVDRLVELSLDLPVREVGLESIRQVDAPYWGVSLTPRELAEHCQLVQEADLSYPIILAADGRVMDGMHRVVRALLEGRHTISAVRFEVQPEPDYRGCRPEDLPYPGDDAA